jgi:peptide/nickel transport system ATP-binding protein
VARSDVEAVSAVIDIEGLSARSAAGPILRGVSLSVTAGEAMALVGESGAGKSTIAKAVLGILPPAISITAGSISFEGTDLLTLPQRRLRELLGVRIALIPQDPQTSLNPARRVGDQLMDGLRLRAGLDRAKASAKALGLLNDVHIREPERVMARYPHELSGGMRQRVLIAQAFSLKPHVIIADEPTTALDVTVQKQVLRLIREMQREHGTALLFVTHDLGVVAQICDRMTVLYGGAVMEQGDTAEIIANPRHAYTRALLAASPRHDRPEQSLKPVPEDLLAELQREIASRC